MVAKKIEDILPLTHVVPAGGLPPAEEITKQLIKDFNNSYNELMRKRVADAIADEGQKSNCKEGDEIVVAFDPTQKEPSNLRRPLITRVVHAAKTAEFN